MKYLTKKCLGKVIEALCFLASLFYAFGERFDIATYMLVLAIFVQMDNK
jgi:hypothetical protein